MKLHSKSPASLAGGALLATILCSGGLSAQDHFKLDPMLHPGLQPPPRVVYDLPAGLLIGPVAEKHAWGTGTGATWIGATQFTHANSTGSPAPSYDSFFYFTGDGRYYAQLDVEPGVLISQLSCIYEDASATDDVGFTWWKYETNLATGDRTAGSIDAFTTSGTPGVAFGVLNAPPGGETMTNTDGVLTLIQHYISVDVTPATSFAGCLVVWIRQISPAPATATFNDVPTTDPFFRSVEALAASGITGGCGGGNFCPNAVVTREQMAAFLARALGLNFQF